jgi:hypothetical protein
MSIETIATFASIFSGIVASADIIAKVIGKKDAKKKPGQWQGCSLSAPWALLSGCWYGLLAPVCSLQYALPDGRLSGKVTSLAYFRLRRVTSWFFSSPPFFDFAVRNS